jgi:hypothetical protein
MSGLVSCGRHTYRGMLPSLGSVSLEFLSSCHRNRIDLRSIITRKILYSNDNRDIQKATRRSRGENCYFSERCWSIARPYRTVLFKSDVSHRNVHKCFKSTATLLILSLLAHTSSLLQVKISKDAV